MIRAKSPLAIHRVVPLPSLAIYGFLIQAPFATKQTSQAPHRASRPEAKEQKVDANVLRPETEGFPCCLMLL